jgi:transposase
MVWTEKSTVSLREEFVHLAHQEGVNRRALCRRFGISPKTGYKWLARAEQASAGERASALHDRSRRPHNHPARSADAVQAAVVAVRHEHPAWGGRKIARRLADLGHVTVAPSTVTHILHRHGLIAPELSQAARPWQRFVRISAIVTANSGIVTDWSLCGWAARRQCRFAAYSGVSAPPLSAVLPAAGRRSESPLRLMRCSLASSRSRMASAMVGSPSQACQ